MPTVTAKEKKEYLDKIQSGLTLVDAAKAVGISYFTFHRHRKTDEKFNAAVEEATLIGARVKLSMLEEEAGRRGHDGWEEPVFYEGKEVATIRKYSDRLLIARIKATATRAGDRSYHLRSDITTQDDKIQAGVIVVGATISDEDEWHAEHAGS